MFVRFRRAENSNLRGIFTKRWFISPAAEGATNVWQSDGQKHSFEWQTGSLFAVPLNAWYQHFNGSGSEPARYFAVTNAPFMINLFP